MISTGQVPPTPSKMMLSLSQWFGLLMLVLLFVVRGNESRLLPQEHLHDHHAGGLCGDSEETLPFSPTMTFLSSWYLPFESDKSANEENDLVLGDVKVGRIPHALTSGSELLNKLASKSTPIALPDSNILDNEVLSPSAHDHKTADATSRRNILSSGNEILSILAGPSNGNHLIVEKKKQLHSLSKFTREISSKLAGSPSDDNNLRVQKRNRPRPPSTFKCEISNNLERSSSRSSPSQYYGDIPADGREEESVSSPFIWYSHL